MVGKESEEYRPRRALPDAGASSDEPDTIPKPTAPQPSAGRSDGGSTSLDDIDDQPVSRRRTAALVGAVAAVVVLGLVIGYSILAGGGAKPAARQRPAPVTAAGEGSSATSGAAGVLLTDSSMLDARGAKAIDGRRTWKVALTQKGLDADSPQPACLGGEPAEGQPTPQQTVLRLLTSSGATPPGILHQAVAYSTPEEAAQAYAVTSKALGGCSMSATSIASGQVVAGLGDQSTGLVLKVAERAQPEYRSVIASRTGRIVNVIDVAHPGRVVSQRAVMAALAAVTNLQCTTSGGKCAKTASLRDGPPPLGGDQPGFLATGDLPPVGIPAGTWVGDIPATPNPDFTGTGCERVRFDKAKAKSASARTYLLDGAAGIFGLDEIVLTMDSSRAATALANTLKTDIAGCTRRKLTAAVTQPKNVTGTGANGARFGGWTATVTQATGPTTKNTYRVGATAVGAKVVYVFLSADPGKKLDLTRADWDLVTVRAGQRATQVR